MSQLLLAHSIRVIDLVAQDQERGLLQLLHAQQGIQLGLALDEPLRVLGVDQEHNAGDFGEVVLPQATGLLVPAEIEGGEAAGADGKLFGGGVEGGLEDGDAVVLEHVEECSLACTHHREAIRARIGLGGVICPQQCWWITYQRYQGLGRGALHACWPDPAGPACPKLRNISQPILYFFYVPTMDKPTPIEDPHSVVSVCFLRLRRTDTAYP